MSENIRDRILKFLPCVTKPARYIGGEINALIKDIRHVNVSMAICYPDVYEIGMSNLGIRIIYEAVNRVEKYSCERVFVPWPDFEGFLRKYRIPLYTLESFRPLYEFDVVGFSIGYELLYTGVLSVLDLGRIPLLSKDRGDSDPIIIAGGPGIYNPESGADFIDVFVFGDGESAILEILEILEKQKGFTRGEKLRAIDELPYTYVPQLYPVIEDCGYRYTVVEKRVSRKIEPELDKLPFPEKPIVPLIRIVQDRITLEVDRGCVNGCRFCQAGYVYRPARERNVKTLLNIARESVKNSGYDEIALSSLSVADYSELERLSIIMEKEFTPRYVSLSLPSLRVNSVNLSILKRVQRVRKSGLTLAVETPDERGRAGLNKIVSEDHIEYLIKESRKLGWRLIKLYFMIGIPGVNDEEEKIAGFINKLLRLERGFSLNVNISVFVPKPHTPLEREEQLGPEKACRMLSRVKKLISSKRVSIKYTSPWMSQIEGILSRGDRAISEVIYEVYRRGERLSGWDEHFNYHKWRESFSIVGLNPVKYQSYRDENVRLPWYFIDSGISEDFKKEELERFYRSEQTEPCKYGKCSYCGVCRGGVRNILSSKKEVVSGEKGNSGKAGLNSGNGAVVYQSTREGGADKETLNEKGMIENWYQAEGEVKGKSKPEIMKPDIPRKIVFAYTKLGPYRFLSQLDMQNLFVRIGRIAGLPFKYTEGFNPRPKINLPYAIPVGIESEYELGEIILTDAVDTEEFIYKYNKQFECLLSYRGIRIIKAGLSESRKTVFSENFFHDYLLEGDIEAFVEKAESFLEKIEKPYKNPQEGYLCKEDHLFIRLSNKTSIKKLVDNLWHDRNLRITRKMIWGLQEGKLFRYL